AIMSVADTGMGMTPEQVEQLFQKFYRAPDAPARRIKGTGLGLYLVKQLVEAHGGNIEVESVHGRGTTFTVSLPREASAEQTTVDGAG
ncbi:MAG TPA: ATP-binding protein, partial [Abditibacteriaceae bacterium]|nr:ATP-binding protein [Abditibacteriaceae bacterium]